MRGILEMHLFVQKNELHSRKLHVSGLLENKKVDIGEEKAYIKSQKVDIQEEKVDIESIPSQKGKKFSSKTINHINKLFGFKIAFQLTTG